jgi:D-3-phosphoglycerate dehydrogenase
MSMKLLIADKFPDKKLGDFRALGLEIEYQPELSLEQLTAAVADKDILVVRGREVPSSVIVAGRNLALILRAGAGVNTIDVAAASERGIYVANCPGKNAVAVAELTMGLLLAVDRRIPQNTADLRAHKWNKKEYSKADGLKGKVFGIVGMGQIGEAVAERARAFEMPVIAWSRSLTPARAEELGVGLCGTVKELCGKADVVSVHVAQTPETKKLFNADMFAAMKPRAIFLNTSRGGVVDQKALINAMREKGIRAGLDVFDPEPQEGKADFADEILSMDGLVGSHHVGASTEQAQDAIADEAVRIVREFVATGEAPNCVNIETKPPVHCQLIIRHYDKVGVLASILDKIRRAQINVEKMNNTVFQGAKAAVATIQLGANPGDDLIRSIAEMKDIIINVDVKAV